MHSFIQYGAKLSLSEPLADLMVEFAKNSLEMSKIDLILAVPLHSKKKRQRQFNQAQLLTENLCRHFSKKIDQKILLKVKPSPSQAQLHNTERWKNVRGTFKVKNSSLVKAKNILLIDDVLTTGATVNECSKVLLESGASKIDVLTLARA